MDMDMESVFVGIVQGCVTLLIVLVLFYVFHKAFWRPYLQMMELKKQGLRSPPFRPVKGNLQDISKMIDEALAAQVPTESHSPHDIVFIVAPHIQRWRATYGDNFFYWFGSIPRINISHPDLIKQLLSDKFGHFPKPAPTSQIKQLLGQGLATVKDGHKWAMHRRILTPAFHLDALKSMVPLFQKCAKSMLERWEMSGHGSNETEVTEEFRRLTADVIAKAAFGSSYEEGKLVFDLQSELGHLLFKAARKYYIPGSRFWPTKENMRALKIDRDIKKSLKELISSRLKSQKESKLKNNKDLLEMMIESNRMSKGKLPSLTMQEMIDECKTFYFAGHETTSTLLTWSVVVLCMHTDWQERARQEVLQHCCCQDPPSADSLSRLKTVNMILHEVLRLYPPANFILRKADKDVEIRVSTENEKKVLKIPANAEVEVAIAMVHHDKKLWGNDANEFNPERFKDGVSKAANHPMAFMPFGMGPRVCIGLNFALIEARVVLSMILQRFRFELSKGYVHSPRPSITVRPHHGAHVIFHSLN